jgi:membrane protease YdiL (CAAX protease family)
VVIARAKGLLPAEVPFVPLFYLGVYAPSIAALFVTRLVDGPRGVRMLLAGWGRWRVAIGWYLVALGAFPLAGLAAIALYARFGGDIDGDPPRLAPLVVLYLINATFGPIGEQVGWRGFALPRMQARHGALLASLLLGAVWGLWHGILWFIPGAGQAAYPFWAYVLATVAQQVVFTWVYNATGGSLLLAALLHNSANTTLGVNAALGLVPPVPFFGLFAAALVVVAIMVAVATRGQLAYRPPHGWGAPCQ